MPINTCPSSRRLLFFGGLTFPLGEKKSDHVSSSSKSSSSPPKYARTDASHGLTVFIRPQTSSELGHKVRSYSHLLKSKLFSKEERAKLKKLKSAKKKPIKKKESSQHATKTRDLVAVNDQERDRCRALLHIDHQNSLIPAKEQKKTKKTKKEQKSLSSKVKNVTTTAKKKVAAAATKVLPIKEKQKSKKVKPAKSNPKPIPQEKVKPTKSNTKSAPDQKKKSINKPSESQPVTPPPIKEVPIKKSTPPPPPPPPSTTSAPPITHTKSKREKPPPPRPPPPVIEEETSEPLDVNELDEIDNDDKNNSVVGRAYHFVKNMFQLSDDILDNNHTHEEDQILSSTNEQSHRQSRKLLSIFDDGTNHWELDDIFNDLSLPFARISQRHLLAVKTNKRSTSSKTTNTKEKKLSVEGNKPKVGWAYRYRISRYLADQKTKRTGRGTKGTGTGGGKSKQQQHSNKKSSSSSNTKVAKRKLLELTLDDEPTCEQNDRLVYSTKGCTLMIRSERRRK